MRHNHEPIEITGYYLCRATGCQVGYISGDDTCQFCRPRGAIGDIIGKLFRDGGGYAGYGGLYVINQDGDSVPLSKKNIGTNHSINKQEDKMKSTIDYDRLCMNLEFLSCTSKTPNQRKAANTALGALTRDRYVSQFELQDAVCVAAEMADLDLFDAVVEVSRIVGYCITIPEGVHQRTAADEMFANVCCHISSHISRRDRRRVVR